MNKKKRELLKQAIGFLDRAYEIVSNVYDQESDCIDNLPENLQESQNYERMEAVIDHLEDAIEEIEHARSEIEEASV